MSTIRPIKTVYYDRHHQPVRINRGKHPNRAVATCVMHMQVNHYGARYAEVFDDDSGQLHAALKRSYKGSLEIVYSRDPEEYEPRSKVPGLKEES